MLICLNYDLHILCISINLLLLFPEEKGTKDEYLALVALVFFLLSLLGYLSLTFRGQDEHKMLNLHQLSNLDLFLFPSLMEIDSEEHLLSHRQHQVYRSICLLF